MLNKFSFKIIYPLIILVCAIVLAFFVYDKGSIKNWDEGIYALISYELVQNPTITPQLNGTDWFEKPPLGFWFEAAGIKIFGFNEFGIRFASSLFFVLALIVLYFLAKDIVASEFWATLATLFFMLSPIMFTQHLGRGANFEMPFLFFSLLTLWLFRLSYKNERYILGAGVSTGLAFMCRGTIGLLLILTIIIGAFLWYKLLKLKLPRRWWLYFLSVGIIILPWHIYELTIHKSEFWNIYFFGQFVDRITTPIQGHAGTWRYYLDFLLVKDRLGLYIVGLGVILVIWSAIYQKSKESLFLSAWLIAFIIPMLLMNTKLYWYLIAVLPAFSISIFYWLKYSFNNSRWRLLGTIITIILIFWLIKSTAIIIKYARQPNYDPVHRVADYLSTQNIHNLTFYKTQQWYNGWILPQSKYYFEYKNNIRTISVNNNLLPEQILATEYVLTTEEFIPELPLDKFDEVKTYGIFRLLRVKTK